MSEQTIELDDDEFGPPENVPIDLNRRLAHTMASVGEVYSQMQWKIGAHAAQIDQLQQALAESQSEVEALTSALAAEVEHSKSVEHQLDVSRRLADHYADEMEKLQDASAVDDPQPAEDAILQMSAALSGQPGLSGNFKAADTEPKPTETPDPPEAT